MKAYVINLDSRPDRWEHCLEQARIGDFELQRVSAVDGRHPDYVATRPKRALGEISGRTLSATETACFESHRKVWQAIVDSGDTHGVVLEDDMVFAKGFASCLSNNCTLPKADIIKLETWGWRIYVGRPVRGYIGNSKLHRLLSTHIGGGGYILSSNAAQTLLEATQDFTDPVDHVLFDTRSALFDRFVILQAIPALAIQGGRQKETHVAAWAQSTLEVGRAQAGSAKAGLNFSRSSLPKRLRPRLKARWLGITALLKGQKFLYVPFK